MMSCALTTDERSRLGIGGFVVLAADVDEHGVYKATVLAKCSNCGKRGRVHLKWKRLGGYPEVFCSICKELYTGLPGK